jgi:acyl-CoA thioesterase
VPQRDHDRFDRLALPPIVDTMPAALSQALGPGDYRFYAPSVDLTLHVVDDTEREWVLVAATLGRARAGWATARVDLWDDAGRYLAFGCQTMYLRTLAGTPPTVDASAR